MKVTIEMLRKFKGSLNYNLRLMNDSVAVPILIIFSSFICIFLIMFLACLSLCMRPQTGIQRRRFEQYHADQLAMRASQAAEAASRRPWYIDGKQLYNDDCPICLNKVDNLETQVDCKRCNYSFHKECSKNVLECPVCRRRGTISRPNSTS